MPDTMLPSTAVAPSISATGMPTEIAKAVGEVMSKVRSLPKTERNGHANYDFASIDAFLMAIGPLCAEAGLIILQDEESMDVIDRGGKSWLRLTYSFVLAHSSGALWDRQMKRTVFQQISGPQTTGSVQSYAQKQFLRSMFLVPTGERDDPDYQPKQDMPAAQAPQKPVQTPQAQGRTNPATKQAERIQRLPADSGEPIHTPIPADAGGLLIRDWLGLAKSALDGRPEAWRRRWLEMHTAELVDLRAMRPDWADRVEAAAIAPDLAEAAE